MQTFLPYPSFAKSARALDRLRLGKQRLEAYQMWAALTGKNPLGWRIPKSVASHPATLAWRGYEDALAVYYFAVCVEWERRGYKSTMPPRLISGNRALASEKPYWFGGEIHARHRANLLAKDPKFYGRYGWTETPSAERWYPTVDKED